MAHLLHKGFYQQGSIFAPFCRVMERKDKVVNGLMYRVMCNSRSWFSPMLTASILLQFCRQRNAGKGVESRSHITVRATLKYVILHVFGCRGFPAVCSTWL